MRQFSTRFAAEVLPSAEATRHFSVLPGAAALVTGY